MSWFLKLRTFAFTLTGFSGYSVVGVAQPHPSPVEDCSVVLNKLDTRPHDTSIELELSATNQLMQVFTTTDGTVRPVLRGKQPPKDIEAMMLKEYPEYGDFESIPWDAFTSEDQRAIIFHATQTTNVNFFRDRSIHGIIPKEQFELFFPKRTTFMGRSYSAGKHQFNPRDFLTDEIHFRTAAEILPGAAPEKLGVELHFRNNDNPGDNLDNAWTFSRAMGFREPPVHQHVVADIPKEVFNPQESMMPALQITEYHRRINTYAEMTAVLEGYPILNNLDGTDLFFGPMIRTQSHAVFKHFHGGAKDNSLGTTGKIAWVGIRGNHTYSKEGTWGLEFRDLDPRYDRTRLKNLMDSAQTAMTTQNFGIPKKKLAEWSLQQTAFNPEVPYPSHLQQGSTLDQFKNKVKARKLSHALEKLTQQSDLIGEKYLPKYMLKYLAHNNLKVDQKAYSTLKEKQSNNEVITWLVKDWSREPIFHNETAMLERIAKHQHIALNRLASGEKHLSVLQYFIKKSGLHYTYERSLGLE